MTDHHVHIGQFNEIYYDPLQVLDAIETVASQTLITEVHYSSTSSCRDDVELSKIEEEIFYTQQFRSDVLIAKPYLWFVPKYANENISAKSALQGFDYCGIKVHPSAQKWDFENPKHKKCLENIFEAASEKENEAFHILIHCGLDTECRPKRFEQFFKEYPEANVILAHSNPADETIEMLKKYKNIKCDIAYSKSETIQKLMQSDVKNKVLFGTDFPVTHYFETHLFGRKISLEEEYIKDCSKNLKIELFASYNL